MVYDKFSKAFQESHLDQLPTMKSEEMKEESSRALCI
jgi:hypothetical protein